MKRHWFHHKSAEPDQQALLDRHRLVFLDNKLEGEFRAAERGRNLGQARFVLWLSLGIELAFASLDPLVLEAPPIGFLIARTGGLTLFLVLSLALTYTEFFRTRWPALMSAAVYAFTIAMGASNVAINPPSLYLAGFNLLILAGYLVVPLIFSYCIGTLSTATVIYLVITAFADSVDGEMLVMLTAQFVAANIIGIAALYRSERFRRFDHLNAKQLAEERARYRELLTSILPTAVADRLQRGEVVVDQFSDATVLFADIVGFTSIASRHPPDQVVEMLNQVFSAFDELVARHHLEKIKTIGDAYMVAGGVPTDQPTHVSEMAELALEMRAAVARLRDPDGNPLRVRIGIHNGGLTAGVIGDSRFLYDLWGDTVNTASRMETLGEPDRIQISDDVRRRLDGGYRFAARGDIEVKGKGRMATWYLEGRQDEVTAEEL
ncbi:MAG: adenylate/guanylate cyclase domain-containing protein [Alphaproteobacteria bacterium]|jgi:class 3 adenylate cyclase|nr:adenylate/guanylate cyclase domain-containing protein [Alphaproteobacteria bacterium]MDP6813314.1 adenylate/guanylate cyclase domain-containing protein [Alphaproteobacteria bacterium]